MTPEDRAILLAELEIAGKRAEALWHLGYGSWTVDYRPELGASKPYCVSNATQPYLHHYGWGKTIVEAFAELQEKQTEAQRQNQITAQVEAFRQQLEQEQQS